MNKWRSRVDEHPAGRSAEKQVPNMTKFSKRGISKRTSAPDKAKKISETVEISADKPEAPIQRRHTAKKMPTFPEPEDENRESMDSGFGESQPLVHHRYPTKARIAALATQNDDRNETESSSAKPAKPERCKNPPDVDKENDGSAANGAQPRQRTSSNKRRLSGLPASQPVSQNEAPPEELNSTKERLSVCSSDDWIEHIRWLQPRRDVGLWIECTRKRCGKWRYAENYHDPLDVPKRWFCEMNTDARFADCSIPQEETSEAEGRWYIENAYNAGSIVWAKVNGFPWWPAMVDDCPELFKYWDIRGSSIVPFKYHVKFFNEMKIAWMPVKNLKPYAENPRNTFLKKTVFRRKDYSDELNSACEVAKQALPLTLLGRLKRFSWVALVSSSAAEEVESLAPDEFAAKKKKSSNKSTIDPTILTPAADNAVSISARKRPVDRKATKNVKRNKKINVTENVTEKQAINKRSRIVNLEADSAINSGPSTSQHSESQPPSRWDKAFFPAPNEFNANSIDWSEVDNSNNDDALVPSPESKSTQSTREKRKCTEEAKNQRCTKRVTIEAIGALAKKIRDSRQSYAKKAKNFRAATQLKTPSDPSIALNSRGLSLPVRGEEKLDRSAINLRSSLDAPANIGPSVSGREDPGRFSRNDSFAVSASRPEVFVDIEEVAASPKEPMEVDLSGSSTDFEGYNERREYPNYPNRAKIFAATTSRTEVLADIEESAASPREPIEVDLSGSSTDFEGYNERLENLSYSNRAEIFAASTSRTEVLVDIEESAASPKEPMDVDLSGSSTDFEGYNERREYPNYPNRAKIFAASTSRTEVLADIEESAASPREPIEVDLSGSSTDFEGYNERLENLSYSNRAGIFAASASRTEVLADIEEVAASPREPIEVDLSGSSTDFEGYNERREYPNYPNRAEMQNNSQPSNPIFAATSNRSGASFSSIKSCSSFGLFPRFSQPEWNVTFDRCPSSCGLGVLTVDLEVSDSGVDAAASVEPTVSAREGRERFFANDFLAASTPRPEVRPSRSAFAESWGDSSFRMNSASLDEGFGRSGGRSEINYSTGGSESNYSVGGSESNYSVGGSEIHYYADGSEGASCFRMNSETVGKGSGQFGDGSERASCFRMNSETEINFSADGSKRASSFRMNSETFGKGSGRFGDGSEINFSIGGSERASCFRMNSETQINFSADGSERASASNHFQSLQSFGSIAQPSQPECDEMSEQRANNSGWCVPLVDLEVSGPSVSANALPEQHYSSPPNCAASWSSQEPASSEYVSNVNKFSLLDILTRSISSGSSQSSGSVVPSSQPDMDRAFEQRPKFPSLCNRLRDLNVSIYSLPGDTNFGSPAHSFSKHLFEVITIND